VTCTRHHAPVITSSIYLVRDRGADSWKTVLSEETPSSSRSVLDFSQYLSSLGHWGELDKQLHKTVEKMKPLREAPADLAPKIPLALRRRAFVNANNGEEAYTSMNLHLLSEDPDALSSCLFLVGTQIFFFDGFDFSPM